MVAGATAVGTIDLRAIPLERNYPMIGLHTSMLNSLLSLGEKSG